jgi:hypothetical protein
MRHGGSAGAVTGMGSQRWYDDEQLLFAVGAAVRAASDVPADLMDTGKTAFARFNITTVSAKRDPAAEAATALSLSVTNAEPA